jgi:hypothetical protein
MAVGMRGERISREGVRFVSSRLGFRAPVQAAFGVRILPEYFVSN